MRNFLYGFLIIILLSACSPNESVQKVEADDVEVSTQDIKVPTTIFTSEKDNDKIDKEELKQSIKVYLDSDDKLLKMSESFEEILDEDNKLNEAELEKFNEMNKLLKENDKNFSNYISNNILPADYKEETERISKYITASNQYLYDLNETLDKVEKGKISEIDFESFINKSHIVNGKEQKKIEKFLDQENIVTTAFGREIKK